MKVPVGPFHYDVILTDEEILVDGRRALGACDPQRQRILIDRSLPAQQRIAVFWHEIAHAWKFELDITQSEVLSLEAACNLVGLAMAPMCPHLLARLSIFLTTGIETEDIVVDLDRRQFIPMRRLAS